MTATDGRLELFPWEVLNEDGEPCESGVSDDRAAASQAAIRALESRPAGWTARVWSARLDPYNPLRYDYRKVIGWGERQAESAGVIWRDDHQTPCLRPGQRRMDRGGRSGVSSRISHPT